MLRSEFNVVQVCQLQLLADVLSPSWVESHQIWEEVRTHWAFNHVGWVKHFLAVIAFHSAACTLHILAIVLQNFVNLLIFIWNLFPIPDHCSPVEKSSIDQKLRSWVSPSVGFPTDITQGIFYESEEVFESSSFVAFVDRFFSQPEFL